MTTRYIFVTGGVVSSLGKGIAAASLAAILEARWPEGNNPETGSVYQRGSGYHEPNSAR